MIKPLLGYCCFLLLSGGLYAQEGEISLLYREKDLLWYCSTRQPPLATAKLWLFNERSAETEMLPLPLLPNPDYGLHSRISYPPFTCAWSLTGAQLIVLVPDLLTDAIGRMVVSAWEVEKDALFQNGDNGIPDRFRPEQILRQAGPFSMITDPFSQEEKNPVHSLSSSPGASLQMDRTQEVIWYGMDKKYLIAKMPLSAKGSPVWTPCAEPVAARWIELEFRGPRFSDATIRQEEEFPWAGFHPVGCARVSGRQVESDDGRIALPPDADWLIWEKSTNGVTRLCQMKSGRWSPVREVARAPQTTVIDNDTETVHLFYDVAIDRADIAGALKRLAARLRKPPER